MTSPPMQLGFDALLAEADGDNAARAFEKEAAHLPSAVPEAVAFHRKQIDAHHAAMLACDFEQAFAIRREAHLLAKKMNGGNPGILAHDDTPGCVLARSCAAPSGEEPLWGQDGVFDVEIAGSSTCVTMHGMFGIGATAMTYLGFEVRAIEANKPFLSSTGYRSFLGCSVAPEAGLSVRGFVERVLEHYVTHDLRGRLVPIGAQFR